MIIQAFKVQVIGLNKQIYVFPTYFIVYSIYLGQIFQLYFTTLMHRRGFSEMKAEKLIFLQEFKGTC